MHAPPWTCRDLYRFDPNLRLCWINHWTEEDGGRKGCFGVVHLRPKIEVGTPDFPKTLKTFWYDVVGKGPLFNRKGGTRPDWSDSMIPMLSFSVTPLRGFTTRDVFNGGLLWRLHRDWTTHEEERRRLLAIAKEKESLLQHTHDDLVEDMSSYWSHLANRTGESSMVMTKEEARETYTPDLYDALDGVPAFQDYYKEKWGLL